MVSRCADYCSLGLLLVVCFSVYCLAVFLLICVFVTVVSFLWWVRLYYLVCAGFCCFVVSLVADLVDCLLVVVLCFGAWLVLWLLRLVVNSVVTFILCVKVCILFVLFVFV